jgi:hypothetical protein
LAAAEMLPRNYHSVCDRKVQTPVARWMVYKTVCREVCWCALFRCAVAGFSQSVGLCSYVGT